MNQLRWALLILGAVFLVGLALWEWRRPRHDARGRAAPDNQPSAPAAGAASFPVHTAPSASTPYDRLRREPSIEEFADDVGSPPEMPMELPTIHAEPTMKVQVLMESAVDVPAAARFLTEAPVPVAIRWPPSSPKRVVTLRVAGRAGAMLAGRALRIALESTGMQYGPQEIYHLVNADGEVLVSAANLVRPGSFDPDAMDAQEFRGVSMFCVLPGPQSGTAMLEGLVAVSRELADRLEAVVQDDVGLPLSAEKLTQLRRSVQEEPEDGGEAAS
ncbi:MAG: cell division protein ZipA C-terminal FtsZ-binding domain-containing protein [Pseudomonadota bacterium]